MSADVGDGWEVVTKDPFAANRKAPALTIYEDGTGHLSAVADRALDQPDAVQFLANPDATKVGIAAADADDKLDTFSVTRSGSAGGDVRPRKALHRVGVDVEALTETVKLPLERESEMLVADCTELLTDYDSAADTRTGDRDLDATPSDADENDEDEYQCRHCPDTFDSKQGRNIHEGRVHKGEDDEDDDEGEGLTPDDVELPGSLTEGDVHAVADFLSTLADVASDFEVSEERAEKILRAYDCLDEVSDE